MALTIRQKETRAAWRKAREARRNASPGERDRLEARLRKAATDVLLADTAAREAKKTRAAA